jgi:hypothetical protein
MNLTQLKERLINGLGTPNQTLLFKLEDGTIIPPYFHITEMGIKMKHFIDCGGTIRNEQWISFQLWTADDFDHRLSPQKLLDMVLKHEKLFNQADLEIDIEYQTNTIGSYSLDMDPTNELTHILKSRKTNCLAPDKCGVTPETNQQTQQPQPATPKCGPSCC